MLDVRTFFVMLVVTALVLSATLWIGSGRKRADGIGQWTASLVVLALAAVLFALRGTIDDWFSVVGANVLMAVCISLQGAAIAEFHGRHLPASLHAGFSLLVGAIFALLLDDFPARVVVGGIFYGTVIAVIVSTLRGMTSEVSVATRRLMVAGFGLGSACFLGRAAIAVVFPESVVDFADPNFFQSVSLVLANVVILTTSMGFLLMHKDRADHRVQKLATTDPLTGACNRRTFLEIAEKELSRASRVGSPLSIIMLDLDHFKQINDVYGHLTGDEVLKRFAADVRAQLRKEDVLVRYGGEEFCVLLPDVQGPGAVALAGRIRKTIAREPFDVDGVSIRVTVSAGVAARFDEGPESIGQILGRADEALYIAKNRGRNRVAAVSLGKSIAA
jgi:diguanylate cyclase (GGDEF)-like protein